MNVAVHETGYYQALIGQDILAGKSGILSPATITLASIGSKGASVGFELIRQSCVAKVPIIPTTSPKWAKVGQAEMRKGFADVDEGKDS